MEILTEYLADTSRIVKTFSMQALADIRKDCPGGTFSTTVNAPMCMPLGTCAPGSFLSMMGGPTSDNVCTPHQTACLSQARSALRTDVAEDPDLKQDIQRRGRDSKPTARVQCGAGWRDRWLRSR